MFQLFRRPLGQFEAVPIPGTEDGLNPFVSADGQWVGFRAGDALQKVALAGGPSQTLTTLPDGIRGADWGSDDVIVYGLNTPGGALMQIPAVGGEPTVLFTPDSERRAWYPQRLPGRDAVLFTVSEPAPDTGELHLLLRDTGEHHTLLPNAAAGRVLGSGHLVFVRSGALWAVPFDLDRLEVAGTPAPVVEGVRVEGGGAVQYAAAKDGTLVYVPGTGPRDARSLVWVDQRGEEEVLAVPPRDYDTVSLAPDGRRAAVVASGDDGNQHVWVSDDLARGTMAPLTAGEHETAPLWSPDGESVVFTSFEGGRPVVTWQAADGSGTPEPLVRDAAFDFVVASDWSPDGQTLFLTGSFPETGRDVGMAAMAGPGTWEPLIQTSANEFSPALSPNGRWLAYASDESNSDEVYVLRFPELVGRQTVSVGSGYRPSWSDDGRAIFYLRAPIGPPAAMMRVTVEPTDTDPPRLDIGTPEELFPWRYYSRNAPLAYYDVSPAEPRFLVIASGQGDEGGADREEINVVLNWQQELLERVPIP